MASPDPEPALVLRLMAWYVGTVGALALMPFLAVRLTSAGFTDAGATAVLTLLPLGTLVGGPTWAWAVDRMGHARRALVGALLISALALCGLLSDQPWVVLMAVACFAFGRAPIFPLGDALTVSAMGARYGTVRAVGSIAYIAVVLSTGALRDTWPLWPVIAAIALFSVAAVISAGLPSPSVTRRPERADLVALLRDPGVAGLLGVAFLNGLSLTTYDHLFTLHLERSGVPSWLSGAAVAWGVAVEVAVMFAAAPLIARLGAPRLLFVACLAGLPRFAITALAIDHPFVVAACQGLHGLQFGAFWVAAVHHMSTLAPPNLRQSAQALLPAFGFGLATLVSLVSSATWLTFGTTRTLFALLLVPAALASVAAWRLARSTPSARTGSGVPSPTELR
ncbi:MAG: MFS transporter [Myxococcota bacterium]